MSNRTGIRKSVTRSEMKPLQVTVTAAEGTTPVIDFLGYSGPSFRSPASEVTTLTFFGCDTEDGTYTEVQFNNVDVTLTLSGTKWNTTDDVLKGRFPFRWIKVVGNAGGVIDIVGTG